MDNDDKSSWELLIQLQADHVDVLKAEQEAISAITRYPHDLRLLFQYAAIQHMLQRVDEAFRVYNIIYSHDNTFLPVISNMGALYQSLGRAEEALTWYLRAYDLSPKDAGLLNNLGSLYGIMNKKEYELHCLLAAIELDPNLEPALVNLGGYYQDDGETLP